MCLQKATLDVWKMTSTDYILSGLKVLKMLWLSF